MKATQVSINKQRDKRTWSVHAAECYSALERRESLPPATTWWNLKMFVTPGEISQSQRDKCYRALSGEVLRVARFRDSKMLGAGLWQEGDLGTEFQFGKMEKFWSWMEQCENELSELKNDYNGKFYVIYFLPPWKKRVTPFITRPLVWGLVRMFSLCFAYSHNSPYTASQTGPQYCNNRSPIAVNVIPSGFRETTASGLGWG